MEKNSNDCYLMLLFNYKPARYWFRFVAYQITNKIDTSKAATSGDHKNSVQAVSPLFDH